jgi:hypothetical protein
MYHRENKKTRFLFDLFLLPICIGHMNTNTKGRKFNKKYDNNLAPFYKMDSEEFAYFLGFFYADGSNNENGRMISIVLKQDDENILKKFSNLFFGNRPIGKYTSKCQTNKFNKV